MPLDMPYEEVTNATEQYIRQLLSVEIAITPTEIRIRNDIANGALASWFENAASLVEADTHTSERDRLGELVHELAAVIRVIG